MKHDRTRIEEWISKRCNAEMWLSATEQYSAAVQYDNTYSRQHDAMQTV